MNDRQAHTTIVLALCAGFLLTAPVVGLGAGPATQVENGTDAALGTRISSFMQASAVDANATVERGMWRASVAAAPDPADRVTDRVTRLERRLERLRDRADRLEARRADGTITQVAYAARAGAVRARMDNLRATVVETDRTARRVGANTTRLDRLRTRLANGTDPPATALARNVTDLSEPSGASRVRATGSNVSSAAIRSGAAPNGSTPLANASRTARSPDDPGAAPNGSVGDRPGSGAPARPTHQATPASGGPDGPDTDPTTGTDPPAPGVGTDDGGTDPGGPDRPDGSPSTGAPGR